MSDFGSHRHANTSAMDNLLKVLNCLGKILQIVQAGFVLFKHLGSALGY